MGCRCFSVSPHYRLIGVQALPLGTALAAVTFRQTTKNPAQRPGFKSVSLRSQRFTLA